MQMKALNVKESVYLCYTKRSSVAFHVKFSEQIWDLMVTVGKELYNQDKYILLTRTTESIRKLRLDLKEFQKSDQIDIIGEFPSKTVIDCIHMEEEDADIGYHRCHTKRQIPEKITLSILENIALKCKTVINEIHTLTAPFASELLTIMLSDTERSSAGEMPYSVIAGYALKGKTLNFQSLRDMITDFIIMGHNEALDIVMSSYDGEWSKLICVDELGLPLTLTELNRKLKLDTLKMKKNEIVGYIENEIISGRTSIEIVNNLSEIGLDLAKKTQEKDIQNNNVANATDAIELPDEVIRTLDNDIIEQIAIVNREINSSVLHESENIDNGEDNLEETESMWNEFDEQPVVGNTETDEDGVTMEPILSYQDTKRILNVYRENVNKRCTYPQLLDLFKLPNFYNKMKKDVIQSMVKSVEDVLSSNNIEINLERSTKNEILNRLRIALGIQMVTPEKSLKQTINTNKKVGLSHVYCKLVYRERLQEFRENSPYKDDIPIINHVSGEIIYIKYGWFCQPEFLTKCKKYHFRFFDPSHIITNFRCLICRKGIPKRNIKTEAWLAVARNGHLNGTDLNMRHVEINMLLDKQKTILAELCFSSKVQKEMVKLGFTEEAKFCQLIREFFDSFDKPGIPMFERIKQRLAFRNWLMEGIDFSEYSHVGLSYSGVPVPSFQVKKSNKYKK